MKEINWKHLIFNILLPLILGGIVGLISKDDFNYLENINRHIIIPNIVFPIVWSVLYVLMGLWSYYYEDKHPQDKTTITLYYISLLVNIAFTPILFILHLNVLALIDVAILLILITCLFVKSLIKKDKFSYLLVPYVIWLCLALSLMVDIVASN